MIHQIPLFTPKHEHRILGLALLTLHIILWWGLSNPILSRCLFLLHVGLFVLWQPFWERQDPPSLRHRIIFSLSILASMAFLNLWLITLWQFLWMGLLGGRDLVKPRDRVINTAAIVFLIIELFTINIHQLFLLSNFVTMEGVVHGLLRYGLLSIPVTFLFVSTDDTLENRYHIDFFHGLTLCLFITILALGSLVMSFYGPLSYPLALLQTVLAITLFILILSWVRIFLAGETGIDPLWTQHLLHTGRTFEQWLDSLAQPGNYKNLTPEAFLRSGFQHLKSLPWVSGVDWHTLYGEDHLGAKGPHQVNITVQSTEVTVYSPYRISASHYFQVKILAQLLEYFHQAKRREAAFAHQAHLQAIHETGAKITHDIKNLLQSLYTITSVIEAYPPNQFGETQKLLQGQMPHLTQRLKNTLDKLQRPAEFAYSHIPVSLWWSNLKIRYRKSQIDFHLQTASDTVLVPEDLFDNVSENIIQNAMSKRKREPHLHIEVVLHIDEKNNLRLTVCDDGTAIPEDIYKGLLNKPVSSRDGFGIGLYQAIKQLINTGYRLHILDNRNGNVCFELTNVEESSIEEKSPKLDA